MRRPAFTILWLLITGAVWGQKKMAGEYVTNFPTYGMFGKRLTLNCDSTAVLNFQGDLMNDNSYGHWTVRNKTLIVYFDSTKPNARYTGTMNFTIKGKRLYTDGTTRETYDKLKLLVAQHARETGEKIPLPSYKKFDRTPKNFNGKMRRQYFKKSKRSPCP